MKISLNWLKEFVDIPDAPRALGDKVTLVGLAVDSVEQVGDDTLFELDVTTNRPDCLNHLGVAREVSAIYGTALRRPVFTLRESGRSTKEVFSISIADPDLCGRYCGRYIAGVKVGPSPDWLKQRLELMGVRSINNVADVTNYVMLELGQPLHAFDADTLLGRQIIVRRAALDEKLTTLDGIERALNPSVLVIADKDRAVALAGVMGGGEMEISARTVNVLLESAHFTPLSIRKAARAFGMNTEASYRFERGADVEMAPIACDRAAAMIQAVAGGEIYKDAFDVYPGKSAPVEARLRRARIQAFLGAAVDDAIVERIFARLEFKSQRTSDGWTVEIPSFRVDVSTEQDLLEEIARHHGFDKFQSTLPPWSGYGVALPHEANERRLRNLLSADGYTEIYTYSFSDEETERQYRRIAEPVKFLNPMSQDATVLRTSLVSGMIKTLQWNLNRGIRDLQFYELSKSYNTEGESMALILAGTGQLRPKAVGAPDREFGFYDLKGDVEAILESFGLRIEVTTEDLCDHYGHYHPGRAARIGHLALFGELHPEYAERLKIRQRVFLAELDMELIFQAKPNRQVTPVPRFPSIRRDFSLVLDKGTTYGDVVRTISSAGVAELGRIEPFDRLESGPFPEDKYSLSISVIYQSADRTLTDVEVEGFDRQVLQLLEERLQAQLRK